MNNQIKRYKKCIILVVAFFLLYMLITFFKHGTTLPATKKTNIGSVNTPIDSCATSNTHLSSPSKKCKFIETPEITYALTKGAKGCITLEVADSNGNAVQGAHVEIYFAAGGARNNQVNEVTDAHGKITCEGLSNSFCNLYIEKAGYYSTKSQYHFLRNINTNSIKKNRWQPWNPTIKMILKEKRKTVQMHAHYVDVYPPCIGEFFGFDCIIGDLVEPYGKGQNSDLYFRYEWMKESSQYDWSHKLTICTSNSYNGLQLTELNTESQMSFPYEAPEAGYVSAIESLFEGAGGKEKTDTRITEKQGIIFRIRSCVGRDRRLESARYGKIKGPVVFANGPRKAISFTYWINTVENERSLENVVK